MTRKKDNTLKVTKGRCLDFKDYLDYDGGGEVDVVTHRQGLFPQPQTFYRRSDLSKNPEIFRKADKCFKKQIRRFGPVLRREVEGRLARKVE